MVSDFKNCWDYWNCAKPNRKHCPVFVNNVGDRCWVVNSFNPVCRNLSKVRNCHDCDWYKKHNRY